ncbi:MAG TPA: hypothetical protein VLK36_08910 [Gaiellaceae bacterium]|nr:hypothetical protein [Gaiellaceae bacterium]
MAIDEVADRLYGLPPEEFTHARDEAVRALKADGRSEDAADAKALRKPTAAAAAVNRLVREHRGDVDRFLEANSALRDAQLAGKGDLETATAKQRQSLERLVQEGGEDVRQSLTAAAVDDEAAAELLAGRLARELEPRGFGTLLAHAPPRARAPKAKAKPKPPPKPEVDPKAREALRAAEAMLVARLGEQKEAEQRLAKARRAVEQARAAVERARRAVSR